MKKTKRLPAAAGDVHRNYPDVWAAYERLGATCAEAGPIPKRSRRFVKLALAIGRGAEGAVHSHVRQALSEGIGKDEIRHVALLALPTLGFHAGVSALTWIEDILGNGKTKTRARRR